MQFINITHAKIHILNPFYPDDIETVHLHRTQNHFGVLQVACEVK